MKRLRDSYLWSMVAKTVTPLGQPVAKPARLEPVRQSRTVDLHGYTLDQAYQLVQQQLATLSGEMIFITGRSGQICQEFSEWTLLHPRVRYIEALHSGGAFRVIC